jgi:hypothetical protein
MRLCEINDVAAVVQGNLVGKREREETLQNAHRANKFMILLNGEQATLSIATYYLL